jgi:hypothetical protein
MSKKSRPESALYPKHHKAWDLEPYYCQHISGMTEFELHDKSDIAEQLAWRDKRIAELQSELDDAWRNDHPKTAEQLLIEARANVIFWSELVEGLADRPEQAPCCQVNRDGLTCDCKHPESTSG